MPTGNNTIVFVAPCDSPAHKKVTYGRLVSDICLMKAEKYNVRLTVGGDQLNYHGNASSVTASLVTVKLLLNSTLTTKMLFSSLWT